MHISWMTLRDLEYVSALARYMHFGKASEACNVSQPALSAQIKKMEERLGFRVFERTNRRVAVTERGKAVIDQARIVLEEAEKIGALVADEKEAGEMRGTLRLGAIATLGPYYVPHFLPKLRKKFPELQIILREGLTDDLLSELKAGELDAILAARTFSETGLKLFPLFYEPFLLAVPRDHPLAKKQKVSGTELRAQDMVLLEDGHCLRDQTLEICPRNRRGNIRQFHVTSLETLRHLVAAGLGYTLMPVLAAGSDMKGLLEYRPLAEEGIGREIVLVCRDRYPRIADLAVLAEYMKSHAPAKTKSI
jgi:LysR family hydrogen peroxide-inducible transcriptional activator